MMNEKTNEKFEEKIAICVDIERVSDDISHPHGFQVDFYGKSSTTDAFINCVNLFGPEEKELVDELLARILPGTCWYVTGEPWIMDHMGVTVIHDCHYQPVDPMENELSI